MRQTTLNYVYNGTSRWVAALSFYLVVALPPILMLLTLLIDRIVTGELIIEQIHRGLRTMFDEKAVQTILEISQNVRNRPQTDLFFTIVAVASAWFSATGASAQIQYALNTIWGVRGSYGIGNTIFHFVKSRLIAFVIILSVLVIAVAGLIVTTVVNVFYEFLLRYISFGAYNWLQLINFITSYVFYFVVFAAIFKYVPDVVLRWRDVVGGAILTTVLFAIGRYLIGWYFVQTHAYSFYGVAGSLMLLLLWIYYSLQIFFFGANFVVVQYKSNYPRVIPRQRAQLIDDNEIAVAG